ncbi:MAG: hypothetical protein IKA93_03250 [Elusimicrobiaceae bacterium]|nr:hypothetical protein [Elusimicrobiaceae bacterium]
MVEFLEPKEIEIDGCHFIISKIPAVDAREIVAKYTTSNIPKVGEYDASEAVMLKMMNYVARVTPEGNHVKLQTKALVNNHVPNWEILTKIEWEMMRYNCSFFQNGKASDFLGSVMSLAKSEATQMLTSLLGKLLPAEKPHSKN